MAKLKIEEYLAKNGISKNELARRLGVRDNAVRRYFPNEAYPQKAPFDPLFSSLARIAAALECGVKDLIDDEEYEKKVKPRSRKQNLMKGEPKMKKQK